MVRLRSVTDSNRETPQSECPFTKRGQAIKTCFVIASTAATAAIVFQRLFIFIHAIAECLKRERDPDQALHCYKVDISTVDISTTDIVINIGSIVFATRFTHSAYY